MASFFRRQITHKIIPFLKSAENTQRVSPKVVSSFIKINQKSRTDPELVMPWYDIVQYTPQIENHFPLPKLVKLLRNQGLPTAEGVVDIGFSETPKGVSFTVDKHVFSKIVLMEICENEDTMFKDSCFFHNVSPKKTVVCASFPSTGDPLSMTGFRNLIHSNFIANINEFIGSEVDTIFSVADSNLKSALLLTGYKKFGTEKELLSNPSEHLLGVSTAANIQYQNDLNFRNKVHECVKNLEKKEDAYSEYLYIRNLCLKQYSSLFEKLGSNIDNVHFSSSFSSEIKDVYEELSAKNIITLQKNGTISINLLSNSGENSQVSEQLIYRLCSAIHLAAQTEAIHNFDVMYYLVPNSEERFFSTFIALLKQLNYSWTEKLKFIEVKNIDDAKNKRNAMDILNQAKLHMMNRLKTDLYLFPEENLEKMADILSYSSLAMYDMKHRRKENYSLDWTEILNFKKHSGAAIQLCHAGLKGMFEENEIIFKVENDTSPLLEIEAQKLILHLSRFDEAVFQSYSSLQPSYLYHYLSSLWYYTDRAANVLKIDLKSDRLTVIKARLLLFSATLKVFQKCLNILGVEPYVNEYEQPQFSEPKL